MCGKIGRRGVNADSAETDFDNTTHNLEPYNIFTDDFKMLQVSNGTST